ncbi:hypothetical protein C8A05DRAFT_13175 [Staphylotrichum tortipilum]|uniref:JmjC domain-containing protein n=1 Tax=Staphylotrichum tortipilum TaxID=2831512 RepID=A0AAN6MR29_9PEZI|nr:hypothetical protein C8A05DRAFT_13175 [Staphylotrichum longicolle]
MDALPPKVDSISGEVSIIREALRGYLEEGIVPFRKVQPPRTKASRDLLRQLLGSLDKVSAGLLDVRNLAAPHSDGGPHGPHGPHTPHAPHNPPNLHTVPPSPPTALALDTPAAAPSSSSPPSSSSLAIPAAITQPTPVPAPRIPLVPQTPQAPGEQLQKQSPPLPPPRPYQITLKDGSVYRCPLPSAHSSPLFDCTYPDINVLNEELFELYSSHPVVRDLGYFKLEVRDLPPLNVQRVSRPSKDHATSFSYKADRLGLVKVDTGKRFKFSSPDLPLPTSSKLEWSLDEQRDLWNSSAATPPKGTWPYIIGNPLFNDVELSPGEKLRRRGRATLEGVNTQYVYFNLTGKTITTMHREDAHVRSENLLRSGQHKFWCFVKPAFSKKLEERMAVEYPEMRQCSQAVRHLSRHIPPCKLDEWGVEYTLDYCVPGQAVVTEPGTYHQVLNLGPNYAIAINLEYNSSPDMPPNYQFCDRNCPDKFAMSADDFRIYEKSPPPEEEELPRTPDTTGSQHKHAPASAPHSLAKLRPDPSVLEALQPTTPPPEQPESEKQAAAESQPATSKIPRPTRATRLLLSPIRRHRLRTASSSSSYQDSSAHHPLSQPWNAALPAPTHQSGAPKQALSGAPSAAAFSVQLVPQASQSVKQGSSQPGQKRPRKEARAPLRKTARMINPDREYDEPTPRPPKRQKVESPTSPTAQNWPSPGASPDALQHLSTLLRGRDPAQAGSLTAENLCGKPSFERLAHLVREWRRYSRSTSTSLSGFRLTKAVDDTARGFPELHLLLLRLLKTKVAAYVETAMAQQPGQELQSCMNSMLQMLGWSEVKRPILHDYLREGKCWATMCGNFDGLLCFVPPDAVSWDLALFKDKVAQFHAEINTELVRRLCAVGDILQRAIWDCLELPEFIWESESTTWLSVEQLLPLLAPFRLIKSCYYNPNSGASWPRPTGWTWDWPTDPSSVKPGDKACSLCPRKSCRCADIKIPQIPRTVDDKSKGPGIRSVGPHQPNDILGELVGELVPLGACGADWTISLRRPDLEDQPVADIYPRQMGNWVRKVGHSTEPSAMFRVLKISGRWRQILVATRHIGDGEEITAKYGRGFTKEQPYSLVEGLH